MALPQFTLNDGSEAYVWAEGSNLPGDRYDLSMNMRMTNHTLEHQRHGVVFAREVLTTLADFNLTWKNIDRTMVNAIGVFYILSKFRYYPDSSSGTYKTVYVVGAFDPKSKRGGKFDLAISLKEI